jgi:hypothetical protein
MMLYGERASRDSVHSPSGTSDQRAGVTLVEVLVSVALVLFIMVILSEGFVAALTATRELKAIGDMQERLRTVAVILRHDLAADHFAGTGITAPRNTLSGYTHFTYFDTVTWVPPDSAKDEAGFFRIWQGSSSGSAGPNDFDEGMDGDGIHSFRSTDHILHFTVKTPLPTDPTIAGIAPRTREDYMSAWVYTDTLGAWNTFQPQDFYTSNASNSIFNSEFAEVAYYLRRAPGSPSAGSTPLYALYRRQRLLLRDQPPYTTQGTVLNSTLASGVKIASTTPDYQLSCQADLLVAGALYFNAINDVTIPTLRFGVDRTFAYAPPVQPAAPDPTPSYPTLADQFGATATQAGDDLLLPDVISFDVKAKYRRQLTELPSSTDFFRDLPVAAANSGFATMGPGGLGVRVFDTWSQSPVTAQNPNDYTTWQTLNTPVTIPAPISGTSVDLLKIGALQITIRVWDAKTQRTRQITIIQNM